MRSSISISKSLLRMSELNNRERDSFVEELRNQALNEIRRVVQNFRRKHTEAVSNYIIHVHPRRFVFYGEIGVGKKCASGCLYKVCLPIECPIECWIKSDINVSQNELFVKVK